MGPKVRRGTDAIGKPFSYAELLLRVQALLRRGPVAARPGRIRVGDLEVDPTTREVRLRGVLIEMSSKEFALLRALAGDPTRVLSKVLADSRREPS